MGREREWPVRVQPLESCMHAWERKWKWGSKPEASSIETDFHGGAGGLSVKVIEGHRR